MERQVSAADAVKYRRRVFISDERHILPYLDRAEDILFMLSDGASLKWDRGERVTIWVGGHSRAALEFGGECKAEVIGADHAILMLTTRDSCSPCIHVSRFAGMNATTLGRSHPRIVGSGYANMRILGR
jgi:hypothetical protein